MWRPPLQLEAQIRRCTVIPQFNKTASESKGAQTASTRCDCKVTTRWETRAAGVYRKLGNFSVNIIGVFIVQGV